jgi:hypothetical protein
MGRPRKYANDEERRAAQRDAHTRCQRRRRCFARRRKLNRIEASGLAPPPVQVIWTFTPATPGVIAFASLATIFEQRR